MRKSLLALLLLASPSVAQTKPGFRASFLELGWEQKPSTPPATTVRQYVDSSGRECFLTHAGFSACIDFSALTGNTSWAFGSGGGGTVLTGGGAANDVAYWNGTSSLTGSANFQFNGTTWTLANPSTSPAASTTFSFGDPGTYGESSPELTIQNNNAAGVSYKWNVARFRALNVQQYAAVTFADNGGRDRLAIGYGNSSTDAPYTNASYIEVSTFPYSGTTTPPPFYLTQTGYQNGSNAIRKRMEISSDGTQIAFDALDGSTKLLTLDTSNKVLGMGTTASTYAETNGGTTHPITIAGGVATGKGRALVDIDDSGSTVTSVGYGTGVINTSSALVRTSAVVGSSPSRTAGSETGQVDIYVKPSGGTVSSVATFGSTNTTLQNTINVPSLTASTFVATDSSKNLVSSTPVTSLNSLAGGLTLVAGSNVTITPSGSNITIASTGGAIGSTAADPAMSHGRLTLTSGTPVTSADVAAATTVYYTPFNGGTIALYYSSNWTVYTLAEQSIALTATQTCTTTSGSTSVTGCSDTSQLWQGMVVSSTNITGGQTISAITSSTAFTLSANANGTGSVSTTFKAAAAKPLDIFAVPTSSSVYRLQAFPWTSATARNVGVTQANAQDGVLVNDAVIASGDSNSIPAKAGKYLGSIYIATAGQTEDTGTGAQTGSAKRYVWNNYNRVSTPTFRFESTATWTYVNPGAVIRETNSSTSNQLEVFAGQVIDAIDTQAASSVTTNTAGKYVQVCVGRDATNACGANALIQPFHLVTTGIFYNGFSRLIETVPLGYHYYSWLESAETGTFTLTFNGSDGISRRPGITGVWQR